MPRLLLTLALLGSLLLSQSACPSGPSLTDEAAGPPFSSVAAVGFALTAYPIAAARGCAIRAQARGRTSPSLEFMAAWGWVDQHHLGIDQGPILAMIENYCTGFLWTLMHDAPYIVRGLRRAGFSGGWLNTASTP